MENLINNISRSYLGWEEITDMVRKMKTVVKNLAMNMYLLVIFILLHVI